MWSCDQRHDVDQLAELPVEVDAGELPVDGLGPASHGGFEGQDSLGQLSERGSNGRGEDLALKDREVYLDQVNANGLD